MKTVELTLYSFDELSDGAKENALYEWNKDTTHNWDGDVRGIRTPHEYRVTLDMESTPEDGDE